jgi:hypothetical protein
VIFDIATVVTDKLSVTVVRIHIIRWVVPVTAHAVPCDVAVLSIYTASTAASLIIVEVIACGAHLKVVKNPEAFASQRMAAKRS